MFRPIGIIIGLTLPARIILTDKCKRIWPVTLETVGILESALGFTDGWTNFCTESGLQGDESISLDHLDAYEFKVTLYDSDDIEREVVRSRGQEATPSYPESFVGTVAGHSPSSREYQVSMCVDRNPLVRDKEELLLEAAASDRVWNVKISHKQTGIMMEDGWEGFANENEVHRHDVLIFKPTDDGAKLRVTIFTERGMQRHIQPRRMIFEKYMKDYMSYILDIHAEWIAATGLQPPLTVVLQNSNERQWRVGIEKRRNNNGRNYRYQFDTAGWRAFCIDNGIRTGDLLEFEYIPHPRFGNVIAVTVRMVI